MKIDDFRNFSSGHFNGHDFVDLGLPSSLKWATCNVGATKPFELGDYFAWGETFTKENYSFGTYKWCEGNLSTSLSKYCTANSYGYLDNKTILDQEDDAASVNWGDGWRMPTFNEQCELWKGCEWKIVENFNDSGVSGFLGKSKYNGNYIFFPAAGYRVGSNYFNEGGHYCSSEILERCPISTLSFHFFSQIDLGGGSGRHVGQSIRAVLKESTNQSINTKSVCNEISNLAYIDAKFNLMNQKSDFRRENYNFEYSDFSNYTLKSSSSFKKCYFEVENKIYSTDDFDNEECVPQTVDSFYEYESIIYIKGIPVNKYDDAICGYIGYNDIYPGYLDISSFKNEDLVIKQIPFQELKEITVGNIHDGVKQVKLIPKRYLEQIEIRKYLLDWNLYLRNREIHRTGEADTISNFDIKNYDKNMEESLSKYKLGWRHEDMSVYIKVPFLDSFVSRHGFEIYYKQGYLLMSKERYLFIFSQHENARLVDLLCYDKQNGKFFCISNHTIEIYGHNLSVDYPRGLNNDLFRHIALLDVFLKSNPNIDLDKFDRFFIENNEFKNMLRSCLNFSGKFC